MKYLLFLLSCFLLIIYEYIINKLRLSYKSFINVLSFAYLFGVKIIGWHINKFIKLPPMDDIPDNIVAICNHINYIDVVIIPYILITTFPNHKLIFISKDKYSKLPIAGSYLSNNHILVKNNIEHDLNLINNKLTLFKKQNTKTITLIFPEGTFMEPETIKSSNKWCDKLYIQRFNHCLAPRINGIYTVLKIINPDKIIQCSIEYTDNPSNNKGTEHSHLLYDYFPSYCCICMKLINNDFNLDNKNIFEKQFYSYWRNIYDH